MNDFSTFPFTALANGEPILAL